MKTDISFQSLLEVISALGVVEKQKILEFLEADLFPDDEDSPEDIAEIKIARTDYQAGDYLTFEQYMRQRANRAV